MQSALRCTIDLLQSSSSPGFQRPLSPRGFMGNYGLGGGGGGGGGGG